MANEEHLKILKQGVDAWNRWREENPEIVPDLSGANLSRAYLGSINLIEANLRKAEFTGSNLKRAELSGANLSRAILFGADLGWANLSKVCLIGVDLTGANLIGANLFNTNLKFACLIETNFEKANLTNCYIYGISAWGLKLEQAEQLNLIITPYGDPTITVDNLEVAQFIYLLLYNEKIRHVIDTITSKVVLILGRFSDEQRKILDAIKAELRKRDYLPVMFDFPPPRNRDLTETISTLAHLSRFIIVDITDPSSVPHELQAIIPTLAVPVQPLIQGSSREYGMFSDFKKYNWVLEIYRYDSREDLLASFTEKVIIPAEAKVKEIRKDGSWK